MIIDCHTHIFPKPVRDGREIYFPTEPAFKLLYESPKSRLVGAADLIAAMDEAGVSVSVVFGFPWGDLETSRRHNDYVIEAVSRFPGRLVGFACFDVMSPGAADEAARCFEAGLSGVGELAFYRSGIDDAALDRLAPVMEICRRANRPVMIHTNEPVGHFYPGKTPLTPGQIYGLARRFPKNRIILAHWGGGIFFFNLMKREVKERLANIYYDTAASPYLYDIEIYSLALQLAGEDRVLFGSDYPLIRPGRYFKDMEKAGLTSAQKAAICGRNARKLLGL